MRVRFPILCGLLAVFASQPGQGAQKRPPRWHREWEHRIGTYRLVNRRDILAEDGAGADTCTLFDGKGRVVVRLEVQHRVTFQGICHLLGDPTPCIVFSTWSGGAHSGFVYYVYSLGKSPRCLLVYDKGNADDGDFVLKDLDGDGKMEILSWYDGFGHARHVSIPVVLGLRNGRYVDVTRQYPKIVRQWMREAEAYYRKWRAQSSEEGVQRGVDVWYATALLFYTPEMAEYKICRLISLTEYAEFLKRRARIQHIMAARMQRYTYPAPYSFFSDPNPRGRFRRVSYVAK